MMIVSRIDEHNLACICWALDNLASFVGKMASFVGKMMIIGRIFGHFRIILAIIVGK
jgi:hypothetical protein